MTIAGLILDLISQRFKLGRAEHGSVPGEDRCKVFIHCSKNLQDPDLHKTLALALLALLAPTQVAQVSPSMVHERDRDPVLLAVP